MDAVLKAKEYVETGKRYVTIIDIKNFFDDIPLEQLIPLIEEKHFDKRVERLISKYLFCKVDFEGQIRVKEKGLLQGSPISPILSNLYLHTLDMHMKNALYHWIRFADNIYIYTKTEEEAATAYNDICGRISHEYKLQVNDRKSGVYEASEKNILGYDIIEKNGQFEVMRHHYQKSPLYHYWRPTVIEKYNEDYHIVKDGILTKKDYALLFENDEEKHHIPVEIVQQINFYSDVIISTNVLKTLSEKQIRASFFDKYGNLVGNFIPEKIKGDGGVLLRQCELYNDEKIRLKIARDMELAFVHNMRANLRYYNKKKDLEVFVKEMNDFMTKVNEAHSIEDLLLIEARARQQYYHAFNEIIEDKDFKFVKRSKRPPLDAINSLISFGNTLLYNQFLQLIWKTTLEPRIGMVHATNRRAHSLNLDFADIFKPIIIDRIIFKLINCKQIRLNEHFEKTDGGGIYLNQNGKKVFLTAFQQKLTSKIMIKGEVFTYYKLMEEEVHNYYRFISKDEKYKPYKYY